MPGFFDSLQNRCPGNHWLTAVCKLADFKLLNHPHGDLLKWQSALAALPETQQAVVLKGPAPELGAVVSNQAALRDTLMAMHPWRKGPLRLGGVEIETEWRSDWKWERVAPHIDLERHRVLDIGCGNGYFGLRMLGAGAEWVIGIDPTLLFVMQWLACRHFSGEIPNYVLPLGIEDLPDIPVDLDTVFSMGVLYHRKDPHASFDNAFTRCWQAAAPWFWKPWCCPRAGRRTCWFRKAAMRGCVMSGRFRERNAD